MPDPIIALLSFVGLCSYSVVGSVVAVLHLKKGFGWSLHSDQWYQGDGEAITSGAPVLGAVFWPLLAAGWIVVGVFYGPIRLGRAVVNYTAAALDK